ncbi:hypothetical protein B0H14DRAFT_2571745 [Mycena olivaceomarginata]|nr:hypothetical protein B0H14DRAFT_2571745 [Mycena olivaceomarginata]
MLKPAQLVLTCAWSCSNLLNFNFDGMTTSLGLFSRSLVQVQLDRENCRSLNAFLLLTPTIALLALSLRQFQPWSRDLVDPTYPYLHLSTRTLQIQSRKRDGLRSGLIPTHFNPLFWRGISTRSLLSLLYPTRRCQTSHALRASRTWISRGASSSPTRFHVAAPEDRDHVRCQDDVVHWLEATMDMEECCKIVGSMRRRFVEPAEVRRNHSRSLRAITLHRANVDCTMGELADKGTNDGAEWLGVGLI